MHLPCILGTLCQFRSAENGCLAQAIVDKAPVVASAVLVSALHLLGANAEIVKRWTNEIQEAVNSKSSMVRSEPCLAADLLHTHLLS